MTVFNMKLVYMKYVNQRAKKLSMQTKFISLIIILIIICFFDSFNCRKEYVRNVLMINLNATSADSSSSSAAIISDPNDTITTASYIMINNHLSSSNYMVAIQCTYNIEASFDIYGTALSFMYQTFTASYYVCYV